MHVASCWLCDQNNTPSPAPDRQPANQILLAPGERATLDLHWASSGVSCQWADWGGFSFDWAKRTGYLFVPSEWPLHICSPVKSTGYRSDSPPTPEIREGALRLSVMQAAIYSDERATLHVELVGQPTSAAGPSGCASLYTVQQTPLIGTRLDPLPVRDSLLRSSYTPEQIQEDQERAWPSWKKDHLRRCEIVGGRTTADADISAPVLANVTHIEWRTATVAGEDPVFLMASARFTVLDVDTLPPNWGDPIEGIRVGLSVDRTSFRLGERIPLHLRWENVNATMPLAQGECMEPEPALEMQDSQHNVVRTIPIEPACMGHGWGPFAIQKGKPQRTFIQLITAQPTTPSFVTDVAAGLPGPGVFYLVSVWSPRVLDAATAETDSTPRIPSSGRFGKIYATARSQPVRVEVAPANSP